MAKVADLGTAASFNDEAMWEYPGAAQLGWVATLLPPFFVTLAEVLSVGSRWAI